MSTRPLTTTPELACLDEAAAILDGIDPPSHHLQSTIAAMIRIQDSAGWMIHPEFDSFDAFVRDRFNISERQFNDIRSAIREACEPTS